MHYAYAICQEASVAQDPGLRPDYGLTQTVRSPFVQG